MCGTKGKEEHENGFKGALQKSKRTGIGPFFFEIFIEPIHQFHNARDGRIEMEPVDIIAHFLNRFMHPLDELFQVIIIKISRG